MRDERGAWALDVLTLNVGAAAFDRAEGILGWLELRPADVLVLTETSAGTGTSLLIRRLLKQGFEVTWQHPGADRGALIATRSPNVKDLTDLVASTMPWRSPAVQLETDDGPLAIVGVYAPSRDRRNGRAAQKREFLESLASGLAALAERLQGRLLLLGDHNTVPRDHIPQHSGFTSWEYQWHHDLLKLGLRNVHALSEAKQPHSWIGRTGNAYLYDYVHLGEALHGRLGGFTYLHTPRQAGLSDHAAVTATITARSKDAAAAAGVVNQVAPRSGWQAGDPCGACGSPNTHGYAGNAGCRSCHAHDMDGS